MDDEPTTDELRDLQRRREHEERERAASADTEEATAAHERRAEKASYLRRKLRERADSEREG